MSDEAMPIETIHYHNMFVLDFIANLEPQFKKHFIETATEDGSEESIEASLNDPQIVHVWKSAYIALNAINGEIDVDYSEVDELVEESVIITPKIAKPTQAQKAIYS